MKTFGVKEVSSISGVSVRTLHYYDQIGLLPPCLRTEAGYRHYGEAELLRLQQILFYKELDFPLKEILELLEDPEFDLIHALETHRSALQARQERIDHLLQTIDNTIHHLKKGKSMSKPEDLYEGLPKEMGTTYRDAAIEEYGQKAIDRSEKALLGLGKDGFKQLKEEMEQVNRALFAQKDQAADAEAVQTLIERHYAVIRQFWGTANKQDKQADAYAGLGQLYVQDVRYTTVDGQTQPEFAAFLQRAMKHFADTRLK
ncbi:MAG: MerR family transcriptional regulator [Bacteroidota bacterium]